MKAYDEAAGKFYSKINISPVPLVSWDIHSMNFYGLCEKGKDVILIQNIAERNRWAYRKLDNLSLLDNEVVVITNNDLTIVHATGNIVSMTGYTPEEIIGNTPKLFQGEGTSQETLGKIKTAIERKIPFEAVVLNYKKDGSTYNCEIKAEPIFNNRGQLVNFIAFEKEVA
ncbi:PAS domain-containing protein [Zobellia amurskyensis]|uniref:PAS domain-containing protein n=1 Tax=Zobellia amurskyensis TaxID=248905 RepID=A0A7X2ZWN5_9FLAO|nr:PAS domain-containing protein [Zobellia amurskyensis]MUH37719.1 PAS domain-containing protein [Zobellia amurskyensis]